jgi:hypothetical protein
MGTEPIEHHLGRQLLPRDEPTIGCVLQVSPDRHEAFEQLDETVLVPDGKDRIW